MGKKPSRDSNLKTRLQSLETQKEAEIEAAWKSNSLTSYAAQAEQRRQWLATHLVSQNGLCAYCNIEITEISAPGAEDRRATIDHIVPRSRGGADKFENTLAACSYCNVAKGSSSLEEYNGTLNLAQRLTVALLAPERLSVEPDSPYYNFRVLDRGISVRFNGKDRRDVIEYSVTEKWIRVRAGKSLDRKGKPITLKLSGEVVPYYKDTAMLIEKLNSHKKGKQSKRK